MGRLESLAADYRSGKIDQVDFMVECCLLVRIDTDSDSTGTK